MCEYRPMMTLKTYLADTGTSQRAFAEKVGLSPSFVNEMLQGTKEPGLDTAQRIAAATDGAVALSSWPRLAAVIAAAQESR